MPEPFCPESYNNLRKELLQNNGFSQQSLSLIKGVYLIYMIGQSYKTTLICRLRDNVYKFRPVHQRMFQCNRPRHRALLDTGTAVPAFAGPYDNRMLSLFGAGKQHIAVACHHTGIASDAFCFIKPKRSCTAGYDGYLNLIHFLHYLLPPRI